MPPQAQLSAIEHFRALDPNSRASFVAEITAESRAGFKVLHDFEGMRSIDVASLFEGIALTLRRDPTNLPALRYQAWKHIRSEEWSEAKQTLRSLIEHWPHLPDTRRELFRVSILAGGADGDRIFSIAEKELNNPLARGSYTCQQMVAAGRPVPQALSNELKLDIDTYCAEIFRNSMAPDPVTPPANTALFFDALAEIVAADTIALVGNGPVLNGSKLGAEIDRHDLVIRCNFPVLKGFQEDVGRKVDLVFFNEAIIRKLSEFTARDEAYSNCRAIAFHPDPSPIFGPEEYANSITKFVCLIPPSLREFYRKFFYTRPMTGMMAIILLTVILRKNIDIFGFDFYTKGTNFFPTTSPIFFGHELQYERWFLETFLAWLDLGKVTVGGRAP